MTAATRTEIDERIRAARAAGNCPCGAPLRDAVQLRTETAAERPEWMDGRPVMCVVMVWVWRCPGCRGDVRLEQPVPQNLM